MMDDSKLDFFKRILKKLEDIKQVRDKIIKVKGDFKAKRISIPDDMKKSINDSDIALKDVIKKNILETSKVKRVETTLNKAMEKCKKEFADIEILNTDYKGWENNRIIKLNNQQYILYHSLGGLSAYDLQCIIVQVFEVASFPKKAASVETIGSMSADRQDDMLKMIREFGDDPVNSYASFMSRMNGNHRYSYIAESQPYEEFKQQLWGPQWDNNTQGFGMGGMNGMVNMGIGNSMSNGQIQMGMGSMSGMINMGIGNSMGNGQIQMGMGGMSGMVNMGIGNSMSNGQIQMGMGSMSGVVNMGIGNSMGNGQIQMGMGSMNDMGMGGMINMGMGSMSSNMGLFGSNNTQGFLTSGEAMSEEDRRIYEHYMKDLKDYGLEHHSQKYDKDIYNESAEIYVYCVSTGRRTFSHQIGEGKPYKFIITTNDNAYNGTFEELAEGINNGTLVKNCYGDRIVKLTEYKVGDLAGLVQFGGVK